LSQPNENILLLAVVWIIGQLVLLLAVPLSLIFLAIDWLFRPRETRRS
jgi:hypothetical protein